MLSQTFFLGWCVLAAPPAEPAKPKPAPDVERGAAQNGKHLVAVRDLLTTPINGNRGGFPYGGDNTTPTAFYLAKEVKPENLAASTARLFLGVRLECAQCHNHPFAEWKREQFWSFAAFFSGIGSQ